MRIFIFKKALIGAIFAVAAVSSSACESAPPAEAFIYINDVNLDGVLDINEWKNAKISENFSVSFSEFNDAEFKRLDKNRNRKLEWDKDELDNEISYIKDPCEIFYENLENNETKQ